MSEVKTNVMRILERQKIAYNHYCYEGTGAVSGIEVAAALGEDADRVFKTLVTVSKSRRYYVFMIPVAAELNLKKAAAAVGEKDVEMLKQKDLLPLTGYVHGGCSPIGMKNSFRPSFTAAPKIMQRLSTAPEKSVIRSKPRWSVCGKLSAA